MFSLFFWSRNCKTLDQPSKFKRFNRVYWLDNVTNVVVSGLVFSVQVSDGEYLYLVIGLTGISHFKELDLLGSSGTLLHRSQVLREAKKPIDKALNMGIEFGEENQVSWLDADNNIRSGKFDYFRPLAHPRIIVAWRSDNQGKREGYSESWGWTRFKKEQYRMDVAQLKAQTAGYQMAMLEAQNQRQQKAKTAT